MTQDPDRKRNGEPVLMELLRRHYALLERLRDLDDDAPQETEVPYSVRRWRGME